MGKIQARDCIFKLIYEYSFLNRHNPISLDNYFDTENIDDENKLYIQKSYNGIIDHYQEILDIIKLHLEKYSIEKISKIDLSILIVAVYEICINNNENYKLEINEAIELAKKYSNDNSFKFVNGVLARIVNKDN